MEIVNYQIDTDKNCTSKFSKKFKSDLKHYIEQELKTSNFHGIFDNDDIGEGDFWYLHKEYEYQEGKFIRELNKLIHEGLVPLQKHKLVKPYRQLYKLAVTED